MSQQHERGTIYINAAERAREILEQDITASYESCGHDANLLIVLFLQEIRDEWRKRERNKMKIRTIGQAAGSVRSFPSRIYNGEQLEACKQLGPEIRRMVEKYLWTMHGCKPAPPSEEECRLERQRLEAEREERKRKAATVKQAKQAQQAEQALLQMPAFASASAPVAAPMSAPVLDAEEVRRPRKKPKKKQEYMPGVGTANYAFIIVLFQAHKHGELFLGRQDLCNRAEASGLSDKPLFGNGGNTRGSNNPAKWYDGFSCFKKLTNNEPPLAMRYSHPIKCKLTSEGSAMAERLYRDAVQRGRILEDTRIPLAALGEEAGSAAPAAYVRSAACAAASRSGLPERLQAAPAQLPAQQPARRGPGQGSAHRPVIGEALVPAHAFHCESAMRQRLMARLGAMQGSSASGAGLGQPGFSWAAAPDQAATAALGAQAQLPHAPYGNAQTTYGGSAPASQERPPVVEVLSDSENEQPAQSSPMADGHVTKLVDMGFTPEQAAQALCEGRTVEEAVEVLMVSSDEDEEPHQAQLPSQNITSGRAGAMHAAQASQQDSSVAPVSHLGVPPTGMPGIPGGPDSPLDWALHAVAAASRQQQLRSHVAVPSLAPASAPAAQHAAPSSAAAARQSQQGAVPKPATEHLQCQQQLPPSAACNQQTAQQRRAEARITPTVRPPQHPQVRRVAGQLEGSWASSGAAASTSAASQASAEHTGQRTRGIWRLPKLGAEWGIGSTEIRLPPLPPGRPFQDVYQVVLVLDQREQFSRSIGGRQHNRVDALTECSRQLSNLGISVENRTSQTGDALWVARSKADPRISYALDYVVERKSIKDLVGSIKNGRYERQKYVLQRCGLRRVMYLIEGNPDVEVQGSELKACKTAASITEVVDGFEVLRTASVAETFRLYAAITKRLAALYGPLTSASASVQREGEQLPTFEQLAQRVQANMKITVRDVWGLMLTALPGVGADLAEAILRVYSTPLSLKTAYEAAMKGAPPGQAVTAAQRLLEGIRVSPARKIGAQTSGRVFDTLFAAGWHCID